MMNKKYIAGVLLSFAVGLAVNSLFPHTAKVTTEDNKTYNVQGLDTPNYTFVNKQGMSQEQYAATMMHEACHEFVRNDYEHFCR